MTREKYRIGRISELMGITSEALRYYEREGIIFPEKSPSSGYRLYDAWDVHILIRTRLYRKYGLTLAETVSALGKLNFDELQDLLEEKDDQIERAIAQQQHLLAQLRRDRHAIADTLTNLGKFRVEMSPAMHFIETQQSYDIMDENVGLYRAWIDQVPFATSGGIFVANNLRYGMMVEDRSLHGLDESYLEGTTAIPSQKCISTFFTSGSECELNSDMFQPTYDFLKEKGLKQTGDSFAKVVLMTRGEKSTYHSWYQGWTPFEGDFEYCSPTPNLD